MMEINGRTVRALTHEEAEKILAEGPDIATVMLHTLKPPPTPRGESRGTVCESLLERFFVVTALAVAALLCLH